MVMRKATKISKSNFSKWVEKKECWGERVGEKGKHEGKTQMGPGLGGG